MSARGKLPAYGKPWLAERKAGRSPGGYLLLTRGWPKEPPTKWHVVVPCDADPAAYDLSICAGLGVVCYLPSRCAGNATLVGLLEQAGPAVAMVYVDHEFHTWIPA